MVVQPVLQHQKMFGYRQPVDSRLLVPLLWLSAQAVDIVHLS